MKNKIFSLRIDLEADYGIRNGVPKILKLLKKYNFKASFYVVMGGESVFFEILKYRKKNIERKSSPLSKKEILRILFKPKDFITENENILKKILADGHELGIHGWKHRPWLRGLEKIDVEKHIILSKIKYKKIFGEYPISLCIADLEIISGLINTYLFFVSSITITRLCTPI